jgi:lactam utilization protein B
VTFCRVSRIRYRKVRLCAALFNEVFHQRQVARLLRDVVKPHQRQLNFRVTRVTVQLVSPGPNTLSI